MLDPSSGLPRFGAQGPELTAALVAATATDRAFALLHLAFDAEPAVWDAMDDAAHDAFLREIGRRLKLVLPEHILLWRLRGSDFLIGVAWRGNEPAAESIGERIRDALDSPLPGPAGTVTPRIGIGHMSGEVANAARLLAAAERDMRAQRRDKQPARTWAHGSGSMLRIDDTSFVSMYEDALANEELQLHQQPVVCAKDGRLVEFNALLRWRSPRYGLMRPNDFMPHAERLGLGGRTGMWVVRMAARQAAQWHAQSLQHLSVSLHLTDSLLRMEDSARSIGALVEQYGTPPHALLLEVRQALLEAELGNVKHNLSALREMGFRITLKDFGAHSRLHTPALTPDLVDRVKIDRAFFAGSFSSPADAAMLRDLLAISQQRGIAVVATGIETQFEVGMLRRAGCNYLQGYLFGSPMPAADLGELPRQERLMPQFFDADQAGRTLLLVDDEENVLRALQRALRREGYRILATSRVSEAFNLLANHDVQVIVSDQLMPELSGTEFLSRVRDLYPDTIRIVLSGYTDLATVTEAINHGAIYRFLTKPWDDAELRKHLGEAFEAQARLRAGPA